MTAPGLTVFPGVRILATSVLEEDLLNPNKMEPEQYGLLVEAMRQVGFLQPILVRKIIVADKDTRYKIIDGHHRVKAAKEIGRTDVECVVVETDEEMENALRIGMNRLRGDLDLAATARSISSLVESGWSLDQLMVTGFSADEVADLVKSMKMEEVEAKVMDEFQLDDDGEKETKPFVIEIEFKDRDDYKRARRGLKKAAGKNGDLAKGLLRLLGE